MNLMNANCIVGRDSVAGTASRYDLNGPGIELREGGGAILTAPTQTDPRAHTTSSTMSTKSLSRS